MVENGKGLQVYTLREQVPTIYKQFQHLRNEFDFYLHFIINI